MSKTSWLIAAGVLGAGVVGAALYAGYRKSAPASLALGKAARTGRLPPLIDETRAGGMKVSHYRTEGDMSINDRVRLIQENVWKGVKDPRMRKLALEVTRDCPERDGLCEAKAVYKAIKRRVRYTGDVGVVKMGADGPVESIDLFQSPYRTWEIGGGDCDDASALAATMLALNGLDAKLRVTAETKAGDWSHIYAVVNPSKDGSAGKLVAVDTTLPGSNQFGVEVNPAKILDFDV